MLLGLQCQEDDITVINFNLFFGFAVCFKIFDQDKDGLLSLSEVRHMIKVMKLVMQENLSDSPSDDVILMLTKDDEEILEEVFTIAVSGEGLSLEEYLVWSLSNRLPEQFLALIYQVKIPYLSLFVFT